MDLRQAIRERRSIRVFRARSVGAKAIASMKEAITWAPSAGNVQARKFYFVTDAKVRQALAAASYQKEVVEMAPLVVVGCTDERIRERYGQRGVTLYSPQDVAAAAQNLLLTVHALGLGAVWIGAFDPRKVRRALHLESSLKPVVLVPIGRPGEEPEAPEHLPPEQLFVDL